MSSKYGFNNYAEINLRKREEEEISLRNEAERIDAIVRDILSDFVRSSVDDAKSAQIHSGGIASYYIYPNSGATWKVYSNREKSSVIIEVVLRVNNRLSITCDGFERNSVIQLKDVLGKYTGCKTS